MPLNREYWEQYYDICCVPTVPVIEEYESRLWKSKKFKRSIVNRLIVFNMTQDDFLIRWKRIANKNELSLRDLILVPGVESLLFDIEGFHDHQTRLLRHVDSLID